MCHCYIVPEEDMHTCDDGETMASRNGQSAAQMVHDVGVVSGIGLPVSTIIVRLCLSARRGRMLRQALCDPVERDEQNIGGQNDHDRRSRQRSRA